jgi:dCTP deaminase
MRRLRSPPLAGGDARRLCSPTVVLSDRTIRAQLASGRLVIEPFDESLLQPSSVDVRVADQFRVFHNNRRPFIDVREPSDDLTEVVDVAAGDRFILHPGEFVLGSTLERVVLPDDLVARLEGKSSLGRLGLLIHSTAGYVDPGFDGTITLELSNVAKLPISIHPGMAIGQISFLQMTTPVDAPYRGKYQGQSGPTASAFHREFERERPA